MDITITTGWQCEPGRGLMEKGWYATVDSEAVEYWCFFTSHQDAFDFKHYMETGFHPLNTR